MQATNEIKVSTVYTFAMTMYVYFQIHGVEKTVRILTDKVEETGTKGTGDFILLLHKGNQQVGKLNGNLVDGWWIQEE